MKIKTLLKVADDAWMPPLSRSEGKSLCPTSELARLTLGDRSSASGSFGSCGSFYQNYRSRAVVSVVLWRFLHFDGKCSLHFASLRSLHFMAKCTKLPQLPKLPLRSGSFGRNYRNYQNYRKQMNSLIR